MKGAKCYSMSYSQVNVLRMDSFIEISTGMADDVNPIRKCGTFG